MSAKMIISDSILPQRRTLVDTSLFIFGRYFEIETNLKEMKRINRIMTNICSDRLAETRDFYTRLFDFNVDYDSDWFVHLISKDRNLELGIIDRTNELVPGDYQTNPRGFYITFVVDSADEVFKIAVSENFEVLNEPTDTSYGQRRLLLKDPSGTLVDISSPIEGFQF